MVYDELTIHTTTAGSEVVSGVLFNEGITCFSVTDPRDLAELIENGGVPVDYVESGLLDGQSDVTVRVYLARNEQGAIQKTGIIAGVKRLKAENGNAEWLGSLDITVSESDDKDWENNWKQYFHPLSIGEKFLICPSWEKVPGEGRTVIEIDPACSFGTGRHETTALCLEELEKQDVAGKDVLDMGCGSGILGIAALKLGAKHVDAVDIDMVATRIAGENAEKNGIPEGLMDIYCGNILTDGTLCESLAQNSYSLILANIVADIISDMLPFFARCLDAQGHMICSGIISPRRDFVVDALGKAGFVIESIREKNEWVAIVCRKS